jgi:Plexin repeat
MRVGQILLGILAVIGIIAFVFLHGGAREGFAYNENPCKEFKTCGNCANAPGCGWCPDLGQCQPMAQDGFPIHTKDLTTGDPDVSPYLVEGAVPVITDCPAECTTTDLGDCVCSKMEYKNSCAPECYAVYGKGCVCPSDTSVSGSNSAVYIEGSDSNYSLTELEISMIYNRNTATQMLHDKKEDITSRLAKTTANLNKLLKSTRIHICSPHTFVIDPTKC